MTMSNAGDHPSPPTLSRRATSQSQHRGMFSLFAGDADCRDWRVYRRFSVTSWPFPPADARDGGSGSRAASDTASLSSVLSSALDEDSDLFDGDVGTADDVSWTELKAMLEARHLKTHVGVRGVLSKFMADKRPRPGRGLAGTGGADKENEYRNLLHRLNSSVNSLSALTIDDRHRHPSELSLAGRRASITESGSAVGDVAEAELSRSCPFDLGLNDLNDGAGIESAGSHTLTRSCPARIDSDGSFSYSAEGGEDAAEDDADVIPTDVLDALRGEEPPREGKRDRGVTTADTEGGIGLDKEVASDATVALHRKGNVRSQDRSGSAPLPFQLQEMARPAAVRRRPSCLKPSCLKTPSDNAPPPSLSRAASSDEHGDEDPSPDQCMEDLLHVLFSVYPEGPAEKQAAGAFATAAPLPDAPRDDPPHVQQHEEAVVDAGDLHGRGILVRKNGVKRRGEEREMTAGDSGRHEATGSGSLLGTPQQPREAYQRRTHGRISNASLATSGVSYSACSGSTLTRNTAAERQYQEWEAIASKHQVARRRTSDTSLMNDSISFMQRRIKNSSLGQGEHNYGRTDPPIVPKDSNDNNKATDGSILIPPEVSRRRTSDLSSMNDSVSFMQHRMKNSILMQGQREHTYGTDPQATGESILTPHKSDLFHRYLENKARTTAGIAKPAPQDRNDGPTSLALNAAHPRGLRNGSPAKETSTTGQLLVEWGDTATVSTEGEGRATDRSRTRHKSWWMLKSNTKSRDEGEIVTAAGGLSGLESRCITIDHRRGRRVSEVTFQEVDDADGYPEDARKLPARPVLQKKIRSSAEAEDGKEVGGPCKTPAGNPSLLSYLRCATSTEDSNSISALSQITGLTDGVWDTNNKRDSLMGEDDHLGHSKGNCNDPCPLALHGGLGDSANERLESLGIAMEGKSLRDTQLAPHNGLKELDLEWNKKDTEDSTNGMAGTIMCATGEKMNRNMSNITLHEC